MKRLPWLALLAWPLLLWAGCGSPLVGAECRPGHVLCDGVCVDPGSDPDHCGGCGMSCGVFECGAAECTDRIRDDADLDGGLPDGRMPGDGDSGDGASRSDAGESPAGAGSPFLPDGGFGFPDVAVSVGCGLGQTACGSQCSDLQRDPDHCGACGVQCAQDEFCVAGTCIDRCDPPLRLCGNQCVDSEDDPNHCGGCGRECRSGLCVDAACSDVVAGHVVVVGHDYTRGRAETMRRMAGNALFLAQGAPVEALVYTGEASQSSVDGVHGAFNRIVALDGRDWERTEVDPDDLPAQLLSASALVIHAQHGASDDELIELGQRWGMAISQFLLRGGVVVRFETHSDDNGGTHQLLEPAGLFGAEGREEVGGGALTVLNPGVGVAARATRNYSAADVTVRFLGHDGTGQVVVEDAQGEPVVIHRVVAP